MKKNIALTEMGVANPDHIARYTIYTVMETDMLRIHKVASLILLTALAMTPWAFSAEPDLDAAAFAEHFAKGDTALRDAMMKATPLFGTDAIDVLAPWLSDSNLESLLGAWHQSHKHPDIARLVALEEIAANSHDLSINLYIASGHGNNAETADLGATISHWQQSRTELNQQAEHLIDTFGSRA